MKFKLTQNFIEKYPDTVEYLVVARNVNIEIPSKWINDATEEEMEKIRTEGKEILDDPEFEKWDKLYAELADEVGVEAADFEPSHTSLFRRVLSGKDVPNINNIVNLTNLFQLKYKVSIGSEDLSTIWGDLILDIAQGDERFRLFGTDSIKTVNEGEVIWVDDHSVTCRMWGWHPSERTKVTNKSSDIYVTFDGLKSLSDPELKSVTQEFADILEDKFGADVEIIKLDKDNPEQELEYKSKSFDTDFLSDEVVIGKVLDFKKIPETDDTYLTKVDIGSKGEIQIVCGGTNLEKNMLFPVALPGAEVYKKEGGTKVVTESEVRGKKSEGMGCSPLELGAGSDYWHYWVLPEKLEDNIGEQLSVHVDEIPLPFDYDYQLKSKQQKKKKKIMKRKDKSLGLDDSSLLTNRLTELLDEYIDSEKYPGSLELSVSNEKKFGDYSSALALKLASKLKKSPQEIAGELVSVLKEEEKVNEIFSEVSVAPNGFINFRLSCIYLLKEVDKSISQEEEYGSSDVGGGRTILIESPSINPNAAAHAGHLLNIFIGRALSRLFTKIGFDTQNDNLINDRGIKICMMMWGVKNLANGKTPESEGMKTDHFVGKYYVEGKRLYREDPEVKKQIQQMLRDWENGDPEVMSLWEQTLDWAHSGHKQTFERLDEEEGHIWLESELYKDAKTIVKDHLDNEIIEKLPDGAVIARLEERYGIPDAVLLRSDGTSLYHTQDIYLTLEKIKKFDPWKAVWVVGNEQIGHFQQLFCLLDELEILSIENLYHFAYGMIVDEDGKKIGKEVKSATADGLLDVMHEAAIDVLEERSVDLPDEKKHEIAEAVGQGALRFSFLARDPFRDVVFDPEAALSFSGRSGPYVMYAYTRGSNVLKNLAEEIVNKSKIGNSDETKGGQVDDYKVSVESVLNTYSDEDVNLTDIDKDLILLLLDYPEVLIQAANSYAPSVLAEYLYEVASKFNNFYENESVVGSEGADRDIRAAITKLTTNVLKDGLGILGINVLEQM